MKNSKLSLARKIEVINEMDWRLKCTAQEFSQEEDKDKQEFFERIVARFYEAVAKEMSK